MVHKNEQRKVPRIYDGKEENILKNYNITYDTLVHW